MEFEKFTLETRQFLVSVRNAIENITNSTTVTNKQMGKLRYEICERILDKAWRKHILTALIGRYITSQKDLSKEEHSVLIDAITKEKNANAILKELEQYCINQKDAPGGSVVVIQYTKGTRLLLSARLNHGRAIYIEGKGKLVICPICDEPIIGLGDLHEALITKGDVMKSKEKDAINSRYNCVHRHNTCPNQKGSHTPGHGGPETFKKCVRALIKYEGYEAIKEWLESAVETWPVVGKQTLARFESVAKEIMEEAEQKETKDITFVQDADYYKFE